MNDEPEAGPAERRLDEHLVLLRDSPPEPGTALHPSVMRTARWRGILRAPLRVVAMIGAAVLQGVTTLAGGGSRRA